MSSTVEKYYENNPESENIKPGEIRIKSDFEKTYPELALEFKKIQKEQYDLFASKMMDYGLGNISLGSDLNSPEDKDLSLTGIWLRCNDKINRLKNILKRNGKTYVAGEASIDSWVDISNYGIIAMLVTLYSII